MQRIKDYILPEGCALGLMVVASDGKSEDPYLSVPFQWNFIPGGETVAVHWNPDESTGRGIRLWEWAHGRLYVSDIWDKPNVVWLVAEFNTADAVYQHEGVLVPKCTTIAVGVDRADMVAYLQKYAPEDKRKSMFFASKVLGDSALCRILNEGSTIVAGHSSLIEVGEGGRATAESHSTVIVGNGGKGSAGDYSHVRAGDKGFAEAGDCSTAIAGMSGYAIVGDFGEARVTGNGTAYAGSWGRAIAGYESTACAGNNGHAEAGKGGTAIAGTYGLAIAGEGGTAIVGDGGEAVVGVGGKGRAGKGGVIRVRWYDKRTNHVFVRDLFVGEHGIEPDVFYCLSDTGHRSKWEDPNPKYKIQN